MEILAKWPLTLLYLDKPAVLNKLSGEKASRGKRDQDSKLVFKRKPHKETRTRGIEWKSSKPNNLEFTVSPSETLDSGPLCNALRFSKKLNPLDTYIWNATIRGFVNRGQYQEALDFYRNMEFERVKADHFTFTFVVKACAGMLSLVDGEKIHAKLIKLGFAADVYICNSLLSLYSQVGRAESADRVFESMAVRDLVSWNSMISGYHFLGDNAGSLVFLREMVASGLEPDAFSVISALGACSEERTQRTGQEIHCNVIKTDIVKDIKVQTSLIDMYSKCGRVNYAEKVFSMINLRNVVAWNAMIGCYSHNGYFTDSFICFRKMMETDPHLAPDSTTLINLLGSCVSLGALLNGKSIHCFGMKKGLLPHLVLETSLIHMYGSCRELRKSENLFMLMNEKNSVAWNVLLSAYVMNKKHDKALSLFREILRLSLEPDCFTMSTILPAYADSAALIEGSQLHGYIIKKSELSSNTIISNSLIHMYAKLGDLTAARKCFDSMVCSDVVTWNTIILAYAIHGLGRVSVSLFHRMLKSGYGPNGSTFASLLLSCSITGMVDEGWAYFNSMKKDFGIDPGIEHYTYMIDLIGRLGNLDRAKSFINEMAIEPDAKIWGSLLKASRNNNDIAVAEFAAERALSLEHDNTGCYISLSTMYRKSRMWEESDRIKSLMKCQGLEKTVSCSLFEMGCKTHKFISGEKSHPAATRVHEVLDIITKLIKEDDFIHGISKFKPEKTIKKKANSSANHSVRLAISFGLISTALGKPVLVRTNTRICEECHDATKKLSRAARREIIVGDMKVFHHFKNGHCCCGDYW